MTEPRIYVANLAAYNAGKLVGRWMDLTDDADDIEKVIMEVCPDDEEWAIHDSEGLPNCLKSEHPDLEDLAAFVKLCDDHGYELAMAAVDNFGDIEEAKTALDDNFAGVHRNVEAFAYDFLDDTGELKEIPDRLRMYFDIQAYARDLELGGDIWTANVKGGVAIFWNR